MTIVIKMDNAAFNDDEPEPGYEVSKILATVPNRVILSTADYAILRDSNGNVVGHAEVTC